VYEAHNDEVCHVVGNHLDGNIDLSACKLDQISCSALGYLLEQYRGTLKLVNIAFCIIDDEGCRIVLNSLLSYHDNSYSSKFELNLHSNKINNKSSLIASLLSSNCPITKFDVSGNKLSSSADIIIKSLHHNTLLTELLLRKTSLRSSDMQSLGEMLTSNNTLSVMDISGNDIGPDGCEYLADCRNISLNKLTMRCRLGVNGADKIGKMLYHNKSITFVDLGDNSIGDNGVEKLVEHLKSNKTIKHLDLWVNKVTSNGANHLSKLFSLNHSTINSIELGFNPLKDEGVDLILQSITITMEYVGLTYTQITSSCSSLCIALHKIKSISFTLYDNYDGISDSLADTTVLEEVELTDERDIAYHTMLSGISKNNSIKKLEFSGDLHHQTVSNFAQVIKLNKTISQLEIVGINVSPSDCLLLADALTVNTTVKEMTICPSYGKKLDQSVVLQFLKQLKHNYTLDVLKLEITEEARYDEQFIRDAEILVEDMNKIRQSHGATTPLCVKLTLLCGII